VLRSAAAHYQRQQSLIALAVAVMRRAFGAGEPLRALPVLVELQRESARDGAFAVRQMLAEQKIAVPAQATVNPDALAGQPASGGSLRLVIEGNRDDLVTLERIVHTEVKDAARVAAGLEITARPGVAWVRMVNPPCCARCAILAGRVYRWSDGFDRHPNCDCTHIPTDENHADDVRTNPDALFRNGHIKDLSRADRAAVEAGADLGKVVNIRRAEAGLTVAGRVVRRGGRLTPERIYQMAESQEHAIDLLKRSGYFA
jgi:hypothetical protein